MQVRIGTSGYNYFWNEGKPTPFLWYVNQGFNTVEINASFYRFPSKAWIKAWENCPNSFDFSIKVHRSITHYTRLRGKAYYLWERFHSIFEPIYDKISFWLFQLPSNYTYKEENFKALKEFVRRVKLGNKLVIEFRNSEWWKQVKNIKRLGIVFCSVDSPELPRNIISCKGIIYLRLHGRTSWYSHIYSDDELKEIVSKINKLKPKKVHIYLNNNHGMLSNGFKLMSMLGLK